MTTQKNKKTESEIVLQVRRGRTGPVRGRHPWIFSGAFVSIPEGIELGSLVRVEDEEGGFLAKGYFSSYSQIAVRVWSFDEKEEVNEKFFLKRIRDAADRRLEVFAGTKTDAYRVVNSENDLLPGLVVDKYADYLVCQFHTVGMERYRDLIVSSLVKTFEPKGIVERRDFRERQKENREEESVVLSGTVPDQITVMENGLSFLVNVFEGQKTGFFLDQRDKRYALQKYCEDKEVLNCFSFTGAFSLYALAGGAKHVTNVDVSEEALEIAKQNVSLNGFSVKKCDFLHEDVKRYLGRENGDSFDIIILDPPAFIRDRKKKEEGIAGYKKINEFGMRLLKKHGMLVTCSCSHHLSKEEFRFALSEAAGRAGKTFQITEAFGHGPDHPELLPFTESGYLKVFFLKALD